VRRRGGEATRGHGEPAALGGRGWPRRSRAGARDLGKSVAAQGAAGRRRFRARQVGGENRESEERKKKKEAGREYIFPSLPSARDLALGKDFFYF
jgi:hypothetical protein